MIPLKDILVITDCDGTLLRNDKSISQKDLDAIHELIRRGGNFTVATGRSIPSSAEIFKQLPLKWPVILYNGSMLYDPVSGKNLWMEDIPAASRSVVKKVMEEYGPELGVEVLTPDALNVLQFTPEIDEHVNGPIQTEYRLASFDEIFSQPWLKVLFSLPEESRIESCVKYLDAHKTEEIRCVRSERLYCEILPAHASKGAALRRLCEYTGFSLARTAALGDCDNDLEMIRTAGAGYVVANAYPAVLAQAERVTVSNEEGAVAAVISEILTDSTQVFCGCSVE